MMKSAIPCVAQAYIGEGTTDVSPDPSRLINFVPMAIVSLLGWLGAGW